MKSDSDIITTGYKYKTSHRKLNNKQQNLNKLDLIVQKTFVPSTFYRAKKKIKPEVYYDFLRLVVSKNKMYKLFSLTALV